VGHGDGRRRPDLVPVRLPDCARDRRGVGGGVVSGSGYGTAGIGFDITGGRTPT
jgi:hypothetical protein